MYNFQRDSYISLSFNEANILIGTLFVPDISNFLVRLDHLLKTTDDPYLKEELESLSKKIQTLSQEEYNLLRKDVQSGKMLFPPNYQLPFIDPSSD